MSFQVSKHFEPSSTAFQPISRMLDQKWSRWDLNWHPCEMSASQVEDQDTMPHMHYGKVLPGQTGKQCRNRIRKEKKMAKVSSLEALLSKAVLGLSMALGCGELRSELPLELSQHGAGSAC